MNHRHLRSKELEQINREILKEMESLRALERYSSRVEDQPSATRVNQQKASSKVLQIKPSSRGHNKFTVSELCVADKVAVPTNKPSNKLPIGRNNK